jgi:hypothetical protein
VLRTRAITIVLAALAMAGSAPSPSQTRVPASRYPNELQGFKFYETSKWKVLRPLVSSMHDVRQILGPPLEANDLSHYSAPYPGDDKAAAPVFTYAMNADWEILIYFVSDCGYRFSPTEISGDRLCTFELVPKKHLSFRDMAFPQTFDRRHVDGADAGWDEYRDPDGLAYDVYTTHTPYGGSKPGDLNRIIYGPADEDLKKFKMTRKKGLFDVSTRD